VARKRSGDLIGLDMVFGPDAIYAIRDVIEIDYMPVDDRVRLKVLMSDVHKLETAAGGFEFHRFERA
jgi:hypothetical protein